MSKRKAETLKMKIGQARDRLYRVALAWCGDAMLADDVVQETMTAGIVNRHQLRDEDRLYVWLYSIMNNTWRRHLRSSRPQTELDDQLVTKDSGPLDSCQELETVTRVRKAVASLPPDQSQVISLVDLEELAYREVSEILGIPIGTIMSRLHRARKNLLLRLDKPETGSTLSRGRHKDDIKVVK
jgi:RNA polymerase sigma-70 factor (ECF subfamily)